MRLERVPHIYHNTIYARKLFEILEEKYIKQKKLYQEINNFNDIGKTTGFLLDLKGENLGVKREGRSDGDYQKILAFTALQLVKIGNIDDMKTILELYFGITVNIKELAGKIVIITRVENLNELYEKVSILKAAGVGFIVTDDEYIEDYTISELEEFSLERIGTIKIGRG